MYKGGDMRVDLAGLELYSSEPDMHRYEARKGDPQFVQMEENKVTDDVSDYP
jgi:hypothetical protein